MSSLFDIAAELSQFDDKSANDGAKEIWCSSTSSRSSSRRLDNQHSFRGESVVDHVETASRTVTSSAFLQHRQSALCILDETLQTIYDTTRQRTPSAKTASSSRTVSSSSLSALESSEQLETRLRQLHATTKSAKLQSVYAHSISYPQLPLGPEAPLETAPPAAASGVTRSRSELPQHSQNRQSACDPDMLAKTVLREINDEMEQLVGANQRGSAADRHSMMRFLTEKYIDTRLVTCITQLFLCMMSKLPGTPFVQLARKKALQKIQQLLLEENQSGSATTAKLSSTSGTQATASSSSSSTNKTSDELWHKLGTLSSQQHRMLQNLVRIPETQLASLPKAQQDLVLFAKRYDLALHLTIQEISKLPHTQQQIVRKLQQQAQSEKCK